MNAGELPLIFACDDDSLVGILHLGDAAAETAVLIIVGGPQYRVGSHRQFVLLARYLAAAALPVLRFDYRGMGDASGEARGFEHIDTDIRCAIDELLRQCPQVRRVILFGLCDAASASLMYAHTDDRVAGVVLLNPWARSSETLARTHLRHYYWRRLLQRDFWAKLRHGHLSLRRSGADLGENLRRALAAAGGRADTSGREPFLRRMLEGLRRLRRPILLIISGRDLTAAEFLTTVNTSPAWRRAMREASLTRRDLVDADHTCSRRVWRDEVAGTIVDWIRSV